MTEPSSPAPQAAVTLWAACTNAAPGQAPWRDFLSAMQKVRLQPRKQQDQLAEDAGFALGWETWCVAVMARLQAEDPGTAEAFLFRQWNLRLTTAQAPAPPDMTVPHPAAREISDWETALQGVATMDGLAALAPAAVAAAQQGAQPALLPAFLLALDRALAQKTPVFIPASLLAFLPLALGDAPAEDVDKALGQSVLRARLSRLHRKLYQALLADLYRPWGDLADLLLSLLLVETLLGARHKALGHLLSRAVATPCAVTAGLRLLGDALYRLGAYRYLGRQAWRRLILELPPTCRGIGVHNLLLNFRKDGPVDWYALLIEDRLLPLIRRAADTGRFLQVESMELWAIEAQKRPYSEENWRDVGDRYCDIFRTSCDNLLAPLRSPVENFASALSDSRRRLAFIINNIIYADGIGSVFLCLLLTLRALRQVVPEAFALECVFVCCRPQELICQLLAAEGVAVTWYEGLHVPEGGEADPLTAQAIILRNDLRMKGTDAAIFTDCSRTFCYVASTIGIAPVQIYWSMGWDWPNSLPMDGFLSFIPGTDGPVKTVRGQSWHLVRWMSRPLGPSSPEAQQPYRDRVAGYRRVLGTVCRSDKLNSAPFIATLARILRRCPGSCFLWTGDDNLAVRLLLDKHGIAERCIHVGPVRTADFMPVIDVFLDTFPVNNGHSTAEAMSAGKPVVSLLGGQSAYTYCLEPARLGWFGTEEQDTFNRLIAGPGGESLYLLAKTPDEYEAMVCRLVDDSEYYGLAAAASRDLAEHCLFGAEGTAHSFRRAVDAIIPARLSAPAMPPV